MGRVGRPPRAALGAADFKRVLACRPCARSDHFVLHHASASAPRSSGTELSTEQGATSSTAVEDRLRLGLVVPKRHARRAVTRNLIKRQGRVVFAAYRQRLATGDWLLRLSRPFAPTEFPSAASPALRQCVRGELVGLFADAARRVPRAPA